MHYTFKSHDPNKEEITVKANTEAQARKSAMQKIWGQQFSHIPTDQGIGLIRVR